MVDGRENIDRQTVNGQLGQQKIHNRWQKMVDRYKLEANQKMIDKTENQRHDRLQMIGQQITDRALMIDTYLYIID